MKNSELFPLNLTEFLKHRLCISYSKPVLSLDNIGIQLYDSFSIQQDEPYKPTFSITRSSDADKPKKRITFKKLAKSPYASRGVLQAIENLQPLKKTPSSRDVSLRARKRRLSKQPRSKSSSRFKTKL